ncbi:MAG: hypothetical protein JWN08_2072, partial [Frankiales bacterium]|nr:hypothetical protein [Frankiales bacterium]
SVEAPNPAARDDPRAWVHRLGVATRRLVQQG